MKLWSDSFADGGRIPVRCAFGRHHAQRHVEPSDNLSPHLAWSGLPVGTRSLALVCHDSDVPGRPDDVNQEGREVPASLPRVDFFHWVLIDLPADTPPFAEGEWSRGVTARGKPGPASLRGARAGLNDYTGWFKGDAAMQGSYFGYDGPGPPWNDAIAHHYHFTLHALSAPRCPVEGLFTGHDVRRAVAGRVLASAAIVGTYAINPRVPRVPRVA